MIVVGDKVPLEDFGKGIYKKETFENETRYKMLHLGSMGHSVPIINGGYQLFGREYTSENVLADGNVFEFDMQGAYEKGAVNKLRYSVSDEVFIGLHVIGRMTEGTHSVVGSVGQIVYGITDRSV